MQEITRNEFLLFRNVIENISGIFLPDEKKYLLESRLAPLLSEFQCSNFSQLYYKIKDSSNKKKIERIIEAIVTHEIYWFRHMAHFNILKNHLFPYFDKLIQNENKINMNIWSAAASSGQEAYSIAMAFLEYLKDNPGSCFSKKPPMIIGSDISENTINKAQIGEYDKASMERGIPLIYKERYFTKNDHNWKIHDKVRDIVTFKVFNLVNPFINLPKFDVIFLRNVIIYFSDNFRKVLFDRLLRQLKPEGFLLLGTGEFLGEYSKYFNIIQTEKSIYYQLKKDMKLYNLPKV